jgi:hypothetical protein
MAISERSRNFQQLFEDIEINTTIFTLNHMKNIIFYMDDGKTARLTKEDFAGIPLETDLTTLIATHPLTNSNTNILLRIDHVAIEQEVMDMVEMLFPAS